MKLNNATALAAYSCPPACVSAYPKLLLTGSTTTASLGDGPISGWGTYIAPYLNVSVINMANARTSTRSTYNDGTWTKLLSLTQPGDFVVIELGQDDEGNPRQNGSSQAALYTLPGIGDETITVTTNAPAAKGITFAPKGNSSTQGTGSARVSKTEVVHTFGWYLKSMIVDVRYKQGIPILSGQIPRNWRAAGTPLPGAITNETKALIQTSYKFRDYAQQVAKDMLADFVDHTAYSLKALQDLGPVESNKLYAKVNNQNTVLTTKKGAKLFAETFVQAVRCGGSEFADYLNEDGQAVDNVVCE